MGHSEREWIGASWKQNTGGGFSPGGVLIIPGKDQNEGQLGWFWMARGFAWRESLFSHSLTSGGFLLSSGGPLSCSFCHLGECICRCVLFLGHATQTQRIACDAQRHQFKCQTRLVWVSLRASRALGGIPGVVSSTVHEWPSFVLG